MIFVFYFFAAILILLSYKSFRGGIEYLRFFKREIAKPISAYTPFVTVIAPCRGLDPGLEENLRALFDQDYPVYEIIFVVDDLADPAAHVISGLLNRGDAETQKKEGGNPNGSEGVRPPGEANREEHTPYRSCFRLFSASPRLCGKSRPSARLVVAQKAEHSAQKIENLREAVLHAGDNSEAFAFVDSDARPSNGWLQHLVAPLADKNVGAATGYRWFISEKPTVASEMRVVWNASIASALGPNTTSNFCWGGSMAIRRDVFERIEMREKWRGSLSDDFAVTRAMNEANLPIVFVPQALTASIENCTFAEMLEFTNRQMKITRVYAPKLWTRSLVGSALFNAVMIAALLIAILDRTDIFAFLASITTIVLITAFSTGKVWLRLKAVRLVLVNYEKELKNQLWTQTVLWLFAPAVFFYNSVAAWASRRMTWRGIRYELKSPTETVIIAD